MMADLHISSADADEMEERKRQTRLLVAAIDFGTTFSGWAFSFKHEYESDPAKVSSKQWIGGQNVSLKAPTTVLIKPDGKTLEAFGYDAENRYADLTAEKIHSNYYYFKRFKMMLFEKGLSRIMTLEDDKGLSLPAKTIFSLAIQYLKDDLLKTCTNRLAGGGLDEGEIHWVLTVPAIWNDAAKQFMREAAVQGGILSQNLTIALEPEAASLFCRLLPVQRTGYGKDSISSFQTGAKYMVLDAGGGTVDITVHEVMSGGCLKELHKASGGAWGGTKVDKAFRLMLEKIFKEKTLQKFQQNCPDDYLDIFRDFEVKKREITPEKESKITLRVPAGLKDLYMELTHTDLKDFIQTGSLKDDMVLMGDKLRIQPSVYQALFKEAIDSIVNHVKTLLKEPSVKGCQAILMVGGFSESVMLQEAIRTNFSNMKIVIPDEAGLVVLKGAVVFGHNPSSIAERVCKCTYGISTSTRFVPGKHDTSKQFVEDDITYCRDVFDKHVEIGQTVKYGEKQAERTYEPVSESHKQVSIRAFQSCNLNPMYVTDISCQRLGELTIDIRDMSVPLSQRKIKVGFIFGKTEIEVEALEERTGHITKGSFNFLN